MRILTTFAIASWVAATAFAAAPVGTASSSGAFDLNGIAMAPEGVSSWPVIAGDEVRSGAAPVIIRFQDGSRMTLGEQSRVRLTATGDAVSVNLIGGQAQFALSTDSSMQVLNQGRQVGTRSGAITVRTQAVLTGGSGGGGPRPDVPRKPPNPVSTK
jgi:hypothetical protein